MRYELRIAGWLSERARGAFQGMRVDRVPPETTIRADLDDQTDLHELLGQCSSMGLQVVSVRLLPDMAGDPADEQARTGPRPAERLSASRRGDPSGKNFSYGKDAASISKLRVIE